MVEIKIMCNEKLRTIERIDNTIVFEIRFLIWVKLWTGYKVGAEKPLKKIQPFSYF